MTTPARPAERESRGERREPADKKILGIPRNIVIVGGVAFALALGYLLYQRYKASQASAAASAASTTADTATGSNAVDTGSVDYSGELSVIQTELESVLANQGSASLNTTGTGTTTTGTGTTTTTTTGAPAAPTGGHVVSVNNNDATVAWNANGATKWSVRIVGPGPLNGRTNTVTVPQAVYSGLSAGHNYEVYITPYSADGTAGPVGEVHFLTTK